MPKKMKAMLIHFMLFLFYEKSTACSCPPDAWSISKEQSICRDYKYGNVYVATVEAAYCKCDISSIEDTYVFSSTNFSCIRYTDADGGGEVEGNVEATYGCTNGGAYLLGTCNYTTQQATGSDGEVWQ